MWSLLKPGSDCSGKPPVFEKISGEKQAPVSMSLDIAISLHVAQGIDESAYFLFFQGSTWE